MIRMIAARAPGGRSGQADECQEPVVEFVGIDARSGVTDPKSPADTLQDRRLIRSSSRPTRRKGSEPSNDAACLEMRKHLKIIEYLSSRGRVAMPRRYSRA